MTSFSIEGPLGQETKLLGRDLLNRDLPAVMQSLYRLDEVLAVLMQGQAGADGESSALPGFYTTLREAADLLERPPGAPSFAGIGTPGAEFAEPLRFSALVRHFGLSDFDLAVFLVALAPELDLRYERLYGFLQDDVTRRRATVDLALNICTGSAEEKTARRAHFARNAPLVDQAVVHVVPDPRDVQPPLLAHYLKVDDQIVNALLGVTALDARLAPFCRHEGGRPGSDTLLVATDIIAPLRHLLQRARATSCALALHFHGPGDSGQLAIARAVVAEMGWTMIHADLTQAPERVAEFDAALAVLFREARLKGAVPYLDRLDLLARDGRRHGYDSALRAVARYDGVVIVGTERGTMPATAEPIDLTSISFGSCDVAQRRLCWERSLAEISVTLPQSGLDDLSERFMLTATQIRQATRHARNQAVWRASKASEPARKPAPSRDDLFAAARAQSGRDLEMLTRKIEPKQQWNDIVLPPGQEAQLRDICDQARFRHVVFDLWGFDRKLSLGKGLNVLFSGPPGTGKSMAAEVIAADLQIDLYKIDLSQIVSKYIGETEKNLDRIFDAAAGATAILFFDEADALFGKRSEVRDAHDRYANIEIGYLLQKMEEYPGIAILATNLRQNLDDAFIRRLQAIVEFPFPDEDYRRRIWQAIFPAEAPLDGNVDLSVLAREVRLSGGYIKNIALQSAFFAAADAGIIMMTHLARAIEREHQKLGRSWDRSRVLA
jgi:SpoVK/Ycf46/Vps4 family AAA+-type ATPase